MNQESPRSGYALYDPEAKRRRVRNTLADLYPELPSEKFSIIYADPPWDYGGKMQFDKSAIKHENPGFKKGVFISSADFKYPTLKTDELKKLDVASIAEDDCLLFMWATNPHLAQAIELGQAWGFEYKTVAFVWNKMVHNPGKYTVSYCELCLVFKRGRIPNPRGARNIKQLVEVPRGQHSEKPKEIRRNIELMFPHHKRIELFARHTEPGWAVWGLEVFPDDVIARPEEAGGARRNGAKEQLDLNYRAT
ncbi:MT-A70 family methyltransferase [Sphingobium indicum]|uniref:MT-A70 family methyltransferase n=1 Tax=Sphingobium indicum TaxID=332055 RepID=UPI0009356C04|nr:MT-A70 family methyltransferase [Sphingobium indicum]